MRAKKPPVVPERDVAVLVCDYFATLGVRLYRRNVGGAKLNGQWIKFGRAGQADWWGIYRKRHVEIEIKRKGQTPSDKQLEWLVEMRDAGAIAFWADSLEMAVAKWKEQA